MSGLQELWHPGLAAPWHMDSFLTRNQTHVPCIGRQILNHWTPKEVLPFYSYCHYEAVCGTACLYEVDLKPWE